jgi:hypothetical protein
MALSLANGKDGSTRNITAEGRPHLRCSSARKRDRTPGELETNPSSITRCRIALDLNAAYLGCACGRRSWEDTMALRRFVIERDIPKVGTLERDQLRGAAAKSNEALHQLGPDIQWVESYVADNKTFCVYLAKDEAIIRKHAEISGFPATKITEVKKMIDPTTAAA